ncbi:calcium-binding protein E63-1-like isoform X3 [Uloborus diversus]|uniref:calcium-binding protein E63-1-like isoform X2 n=1 Tax=Uloborus diversus TaxID=327109 RepID=UPI00240A90C2|nr:calcium-binding protein E63-1-like isoform X2 [Uloborus diversus]XP_054716093.1 calcium-binding protein E63-1-like isoform X3 [Uloborus diversus]
MEAQKGLSESQVKELKTAFCMLDKNQDGRVNLSEMKMMLSNLGIKIEDCVVEALISQASERDDGLVSEEEFLGWMASQEEIGGQEDDIMEDLLAAFRVFDKDGNGYITKDELKMAMDIIGEPVTEVQLDEMLKATDIDHDGRINYEEFVKILL